MGSVCSRRATTPRVEGSAWGRFTLALLGSERANRASLLALRKHLWSSLGKYLQALKILEAQISADHHRGLRRNWVALGRQLRR